MRALAITMGTWTSAHFLFARRPPPRGCVSPTRRRRTTDLASSYDTPCLQDGGSGRCPPNRDRLTNPLGHYSQKLINQPLSRHTPTARLRTVIVTIRSPPPSNPRFDDRLSLLREFEEYRPSKAATHIALGLPLVDSSPSGVHRHPP